MTPAQNEHFKYNSGLEQHHICIRSVDALGVVFSRRTVGLAGEIIDKNIRLEAAEWMRLSRTGQLIKCPADLNNETSKMTQMPDGTWRAIGTRGQTYDQLDKENKRLARALYLWQIAGIGCAVLMLLCIGLLILRKSA